MWVQVPILPGFPSDLTGVAHLPAFSSAAAEHPPLLGTALLMETILQNCPWTCEGCLSPVAAAVPVLPEEPQQEVADHSHHLPPVLACRHVLQASCGTAELWISSGKPQAYHKLWG